VQVLHVTDLPRRKYCVEMRPHLFATNGEADGDRKTNTYWTSTTGSSPKL